MTVSVGWLPPGDQWDTSMIADLLQNELSDIGLTFDHHPDYPRADGAVILIPARYFSDQTDKINYALSSYRWVLGILTSDEESTFPLESLIHPNARYWVQTPRAGRDYGDARLFGVGYSPHFRHLPEPVKDTDVFLAAQKSNGLPGDRFRMYERRAAWFDALKQGGWSKVLVERDGFAQGDRAEYVSGMLSAKIAPAPTGMVSVDSFRFYEALQAGCVPVADAVSDVDGPTTYWSRLFGDDLPFPIVTDVADLPGIIDDVLADWPARADRVSAWWCRQKREYSRWLIEDLKALGALR